MATRVPELDDGPPAVVGTDSMPPVWIGEAVLHIPEPEWLLPDFIQKKGMTIVHAAHRSGKSVILMDWANLLSLPSTGERLWNWHGREIPRQCRVMYIMGEGQGGLKGRLLAWMKSRTVRDLPNVHWIMRAVNLRRLQPGIPTAEQNSICAYIEANEIDVVFIDTLSATFGSGNENMQQDMNLYVETLASFQEAGAAVVVAHHESKAGEVRGSTVLSGSADGMIRLEGTFDADGALTHSKVTMSKLKDGVPWKSFILKLQQHPVDTQVGQSISFGYATELTAKLRGQIDKGKNAERSAKDILWCAVEKAMGTQNWTQLRATMSGLSQDKKAEIRDAMVAAEFLKYNPKGNLVVGKPLTAATTDTAPEEAEKL